MNSPCLNFASARGNLIHLQRPGSRLLAPQIKLLSHTQPTMWQHCPLCFGCQWVIGIGNKHFFSVMVTSISSKARLPASTHFRLDARQNLLLTKMQLPVSHFVWKDDAVSSYSMMLRSHIVSPCKFHANHRLLSSTAHTLRTSRYPNRSSTAICLVWYFVTQLKPEGGT